MQGRVCRKRQISQILAASLEQHTLHNYDDSIRAKNNDPLEVFVFTDFFERLSVFRWDVRDKP
jgi:hypothetical protein